MKLGIECTISHLCIFLLCMALMPCATKGKEQVRMTLVSRNHFRSEVDSQYECHLSEPDEDSTVSSLRTNHTRACVNDYWHGCDPILLDQLNPEPPFPQREPGNRNTDPLSYFVVNMINDGKNNAFGVFACRATNMAKVKTMISTTRMRSDALTVPADDLFTKTVNVDDTNVSISVKFHNVSGPDSNLLQSKLRWRNNSEFRNDEDDHDEAKYFGIKSFPIEGPVQLYHSGIYECHLAGGRSRATHALIILIVRACHANMWGPPDCEGVCDSCYNGGICDEGTGKCICPPGFMGPHCLTACGGNRYGHFCEKKCSSSDMPERCGGILFCLVHPFGCRCNTGWKGLDCNTGCDVNTYGANCLQSCHCASGQCNRYTGVCEGTDTSCEPGWTGDNCQECADNRFGLNCSEECHCLKEYCNRETGLCNGQCLPQWVEEPDSPHSCQTGLLITSITNGVNPNVTATFDCTAKASSSGGLGNLLLALSREEKILNNGSMSEQSNVFIDSQMQRKTFEVQTGEEGEVFYCQLWKNAELMAVLNISRVHTLPVLSQAPDWLISESTNTSITIRWKSWDPDKDDGDPPVVAYIPYYRRNSSEMWTRGSLVPAVETLEFTAFNLTVDTNYTFVVTVVRKGEGGEGRFSPPLLTKTSPLCQIPGERFLSWEDCLILMKKQRAHKVTMLILVISSTALVLIFVLVVGVVWYKRRNPAILIRKLTDRRPTPPVEIQCNQDVASPCMQLTAELKTVNQNGRKDVNAYHMKQASPVEEGELEGYEAVNQPTTVPVSQFYKYDLSILEEEYQLLPKGKTHSWTVGHKEQNRVKNRFKDMYTYDHSRVTLEKINGDEYSDYYNASFILNQNGEEAFIAAQGPNSCSCNDFWRMIWEHNVSMVVMVTNLFKGNKERCKKYWPENEGNSCRFDSLEVLWTETSCCADYVIRTFKVTKGNMNHTVHQHHFLSWPDSDIPETPTPFIEFVKRTKSMQSHQGVPVLVHCSAGIGKTGVYIALSCLMEVLQTEAYIDVFSFVEQMRQNRINMVQSVKEYEFLYRCLLEFLPTKHTEISAHYLATEYPHDKFIVFQNEFELLKSFMDEQKLAAKMYEGLQPENESRNRFPYVVPCDDSMPTLISESQFENPYNYINASVVNSFRKEDAFILTQAPLSNTVEDFWRMVYDWKCPLIVMLNQIDHNDESCLPYWPESGTLHYGYMSVTHIMAESRDYVIHHLFDVSHKHCKETFSVHHLQLTDWPPEGSLQSILETIGEVEKMQKDFKMTAPTVIQCIDGVSRSAVFATVKSEMERLEETSKLNVFSTVKQLRESNVNFLMSWDLYSLVYQLLYVKIHESSSTEAIY
ncbi:Receptor-type tyrosine-protein phosphatase T [Holothuria leucospilota]|uniref:protein-tyrosine-phosphatase n=1 Tax=Holothuria leucospilota TaxID=206669 RepID=A0A9Q1C6Y2_HOLLE|nr:Receptor-type tyrosine-protein phosphatase T [Holothuria leucospilota]